MNLATPMGGRLAVVHDRVARNDDSITSAPSTPTEIDIVTEKRQGRVEAIERIPDVSSNQHAGTAHGQNITSSIMLTLIQLAPL
jgi:hypothetical protein